MFELLRRNFTMNLTVHGQAGALSVIKPYLHIDLINNNKFIKLMFICLHYEYNIVYITYTVP